MSFRHGFPIEDCWEIHKGLLIMFRIPHSVCSICWMRERRITMMSPPTWPTFSAVLHSFRLSMPLTLKLQSDLTVYFWNIQGSALIFLCFPRQQLLFYFSTPIQILSKTLSSSELIILTSAGRFYPFTLRLIQHRFACYPCLNQWIPYASSSWLCEWRQGSIWCQGGHGRAKSSEAWESAQRKWRESSLRASE